MKLSVIWSAFNGGIVYKVRTVEVGTLKVHIWRLWNIRAGISRYGVSTNDLAPATFFTCAEKDVFSHAIGNTYNELARFGDDALAQNYYEAFIRSLLLASHQYMKEATR